MYTSTIPRYSRILENPGILCRRRVAALCACVHVHYLQVHWDTRESWDTLPERERDCALHMYTISGYLLWKGGDALMYTRAVIVCLATTA